MQFRFKDKEKPRAYTSSLSGVLHVSSLTAYSIRNFVFTCITFLSHVTKR